MEQGVSLETFVDLLTSEQQAMFAYIVAQIPHVSDANDVLQETNLVLWRKREEYRGDAPFGPWARAIAHYQVLAFAKRRGRDRLRFGENFMKQLSEESEAYEAREIDREQAALGECVEELAPVKFDLLQMRYSALMTIAQIAERTGQSPGAVADALYRIRIWLAKCIEKKLKDDWK